MTDQELNIKIAKLLGYSISVDYFDFEDPVTGYWLPIKELPNFTNDLNAIHEVVKSLSKDQRNTYHRLLTSNGTDPASYEWYDGIPEAIDAAARQRAEALFKTINPTSK